MRQPTFIVLEAGGPDALGALERACADLAASGLRVVRSFDGARSGMACAGAVTNERDAQRAVLAALAGAHLVVLAQAPREVIDMLCDDLRRLGALDHRVGGQDGAVPGLGGTQGGTQGSKLSDQLSDTERALLERLLAGDSLGAAASALHLSRRTADRRLAAARAAIGATTTAEALAIAVRLGLRPAQP